MKRILVTGSNGLLGQTLTHLILTTKRAELIASSKGANRYLKSDGYKYLELDICDKQQLAAAVLEYKPDVIINTAAITNVDTCHLNHEFCWSINVDGVKNLIQVCQANNIHL